MTAFGKGLLENVTAKLSQLSGNHELEVVPARTLEDKKVTSLADAKKEFGVSLGLTLSLEQAGELVRAAYSLTDAKTGKNLAGAQITAPVSDLFTIEDQVANGVAAALQISLRSDEKQAFGAHFTSQPEAYQYFRAGTWLFAELAQARELNERGDCFQTSLETRSQLRAGRSGLGPDLLVEISGGQAEPMDRSCPAGVH